MAEMINPIGIVKVDPENLGYILIATLVDDNGERRKEWFEFNSRKELYTFIKENLESESEIIDIICSYIMMEGETYTANSGARSNVAAFMTVVSSIYGESFYPDDYIIGE